jgi:hypothetical protein
MTPDTDAEAIYDESSDGLNFMELSDNDQAVDTEIIPSEKIETLMY